MTIQLKMDNQHVRIKNLELRKKKKKKLIISNKFLVPASILTLLKIPQIMVCALSIMATSASIGFLGATLEPHLRGFNLTPVITGKIQN